MLNVSQIEFQILKWEPRSVPGTWDTREFVPQTLLMLKPPSLPLSLSTLEAEWEVLKAAYNRGPSCKWI